MVRYIRIETFFHAKQMSLQTTEGEARITNPRQRRVSIYITATAIYFLLFIHERTIRNPR